MHSHPAGFTYTTNGQPAAGPASVPSQSKPSQPMVTIRRVQNPSGADEPMASNLQLGSARRGESYLSCICPCLH